MDNGTSGTQYEDTYPGELKAFITFTNQSDFKRYHYSVDFGADELVNLIERYRDHRVSIDHMIVPLESYGGITIDGVEYPVLSDERAKQHMLHSMGPESWDTESARKEWEAPPDMTTLSPYSVEDRILTKLHELTRRAEDMEKRLDVILHAVHAPRS